MYVNNSYEKKGVKNRLRESIILFVFIIISLVISLLAIDVIIFPIALFATRYMTIFTFIVKYLFWCIIIATLLYMLIKNIYSLKKDDRSGYQIIKAIILKPVSFLFKLIFILLLCLTLVFTMNILLQKNYYFIYKLLNI